MAVKSPDDVQASIGYGYTKQSPTPAGVLDES